METAIVIRRIAITSRPQWALIIQSVNGYSICVVDRDVGVVEGQELSRHHSHRGVWVLSGSGKVFPATINGGLSLNEAEAALSKILAL